MDSGGVYTFFISMSKFIIFMRRCNEKYYCNLYCNFKKSCSNATLKQKQETKVYIYCQWVMHVPWFKNLTTYNRSFFHIYIAHLIQKPLNNDIPIIYGPEIISHVVTVAR